MQDSSFEAGTFSLAAAPCGPDTRPRDAATNVTSPSGDTLKFLKSDMSKLFVPGFGKKGLGQGETSPGSPT